MGCKFGKDRVKLAQHSPSQFQAVPKSTFYKHLSRYGADCLPKAGKYTINVDSRVTSKYNIKAVVGKGAFSEVLRVESKVSKQPFAVKLVKIQGDIEKHLCASELGALTKISHRFIVKLEEVIVSKSVVYLVMQLATGGELYDRIKSRGHLDEKYSCQVTQMLLEGIIYLHLNGIIHRDLKPENILFYHPGNDSKIVITDFGFAKVQCENAGNLSTTWCGTPEYVAPELIKEIPYDHKVDMWALGVIVYVMLSGQLPFNAATTPKLFNLIVNCSFSYRKPIWNNVSESAKDFINKLIVNPPLLRLDSVDANFHPWIKSYSPLHKTKENVLLNKFSVAVKRRRVMSTKEVAEVPNIFTIADKSVVRNSEGGSKVSDDNVFQASSLGLPASVKPSKGSLSDGRLILPVSGEFLGNTITKEKVLEDNTSTMSPSNVDSLLAVEESVSSASNCGKINNFSKYSAKGVTINKHPTQYLFSKKGQNQSEQQFSPSNEIHLPMKFNEKVGQEMFYNQFENIDENSEDEENYELVMKDEAKFMRTSFGVAMPVENSLKSHYIEKVGVWLNEAVKSDIQEPYFVEESMKRASSAESLVTLEKTISSNSYSHQSSFNRFLLPSIHKSEQDLNIPLKPLKNSSQSSNDNIKSDSPTDDYGNSLNSLHSYTPLNP